MHLRDGDPSSRGVYQDRYIIGGEARKAFADLVPFTMQCLLPRRLAFHPTLLLC